MDYMINLPVQGLAQTLAVSYPDGVHLSPLDAQRVFDYTQAYGGSPNVYFGPLAPPCQYQYMRAGVVIAPRSVAGLASFTARDWPGIGLESGVTYEWVGRFIYTAVAPPGSFVVNNTGVC